MWALRGAAPLLLWALGSFCAARENPCLQNIIIGIEGKDIVLNPSISGSPTDITWKKEGNIVAASRGDFIINNETMSIFRDGSLFLKNLSQSDVGHYKAEIQVEDELTERFFCLKVLGHLGSPILECSFINNSIQVSCIPPAHLQDLSPSSHWKDIEDDKIIYQNQSFVQLRGKTDPSKNITCVIVAFNINISNFITLSKCRMTERHHTGGRSRVMILVAVILVLLVLIGSYIVQKCATKQGEDGRIEGGPVLSSEEEPLNQPGANLGSSENLEENRNEPSAPES